MTSIDNIFTDRENVANLPILRKFLFQGESLRKDLCGMETAILRVFEAGYVSCWGALTISFDCGDKAAYLWVQSLPARQSSLIRILSNENVKKRQKRENNF